MVYSRNFNGMVNMVRNSPEAWPYEVLQLVLNLIPCAALLRILRILDEFLLDRFTVLHYA